MTTEQKAKAYDEALQRARELNSGKDVDAVAGTTICEYIFPELKESEDERIKREILELVSIAGNGNQFEEIKDWLEKQGKQKTEPKFHPGNSGRIYMEKSLSEDYCSYEVAKLLKEKGFDESTTFVWCPTHQMAMKWLREEQGIVITIDYDEDEDCKDNERYGFTVYRKNERDVGVGTHPTYEEAVEAALKYCLTII